MRALCASAEASVAGAIHSPVTRPSPQAKATAQAVAPVKRRTDRPAARSATNSDWLASLPKPIKLPRNRT